MDKRLLHYYERELRYIRELGREFARTYSKVGARLGIRDEHSDDAHVERLFQGHSLLAARVQQRLDAEFPRFSEALLGHVYPNHLAATPSMVIVQLQPDTQQGSLERGYEVAAGSVLRTRTRTRAGVACEYRTAHPVRLWPVTLESAHYTSVLREIEDVRVPTREPVRALLRLRLRTTGGRTFSKLNLSSLPIHLHGADEKTGRLYEALVAHSSALIGRWISGNNNQMVRSSAQQPVRPMGFDEEHALLPSGPKQFRGIRLLQEYFAMPSRYHFVELQGIGEAVTRCDSSTLELFVLLSHYDPALEGTLDPQQVRLYATPAVNLFPLVCDLLKPAPNGEATLIVPDRARPKDIDVHSIRRVTMVVSGTSKEREILPMSARFEWSDHDAPLGHYEVERRPRSVPDDEQPSSLLRTQDGSEAFLRLKLSSGQPDLMGNQQLRIEALCSNRDLPTFLEQGKLSDFTMTNAGPVKAIRCISGPTVPSGYDWDGETTWSLISHLSQSYLAVCDGGDALRELLDLYSKCGSPQLQREVAGIRAVVSAPVVGPFPAPGPRQFVRGIEINVTCEERAFGAHRFFLLASVLSEFFARQASVHSFTQTVLHTPERGEVHRWPAIAGLRAAL